jgi:hypothetical protein
MAMLFGVSRTPKGTRVPRGPGRWIALHAGEAFVVEGHRDLLDLGTTAGRLTFAVAALVVAVAAFASRLLAPEAPYLLAIDALGLVPLFATGVRAQLPPDLARAPVPLLSTAFDALEKDRAISVVPWARMPLGSDRPDEMRLLVLPRASLPGLVGIELGVSWGRTATGFAPRPEVLIRVHDATDASTRLAKIVPFARPMTGRKPEEKVVRILPRLPGGAAALSLVRRLARELVDRRLTIGGWNGPERRLDRDPTDKVPAAA